MAVKLVKLTFFAYFFIDFQLNNAEYFYNKMTQRTMWRYHRVKSIQVNKK